MKKLISKVMLATMIAGVAMPLVSLAQTAPQDSCVISNANVANFDPACTGTVSGANTPNWGMCCMLDALYTVIDWVFLFLIVMVSLLIIWGGFSIATAGGAADKIDSGRKYIMYALIGLAIALLSRAIPAVVIGLVS